MKILVTGSLGFIATNLILSLSKDKEYKIIGVDSGISKSINKGFTEDICKHKIFDISNKEKLCKLLHNVDIVIHLAANGNVIESINRPILNFQNNVASTLNLLECMREMNVKKLIFSSTGGALMGNSESPVNENSIPNPISPYGASKLSCEGYISSYAETFNISSVILRFGNVYGPFSLHKSGVFNKWIFSALNKEPLLIYGDGTSTRDYIHVQDLCNGINLAIKLLKSENSEKLNIFHLANSSEITLNYLAEVLSKVHGGNLKIDYLPSRKGEVHRNFADISKAMKSLGFKPEISLIDGVKEVYKWFMEFGYSKKDLIENKNF